MDEKRSHWANIWAPTEPKLSDLDAAFDEVRIAAEDEVLPDLDAAAIRRATKKMRPKLGQGVDRLSPLDIERLPDSALTELSSLFETIEEALAWPIQTQLVIGHMMPKHRGSGDRIIGILTMFARVWSMCREPE
eukprot:5205779-Pyramimonas_sp.AAC.1